jgi:hypothetical protein
VNNPARVTGMRPRTIPERRVSTINKKFVLSLPSRKNSKFFGFFLEGIESNRHVFQALESARIFIQYF